MGLASAADFSTNIMETDGCTCWAGSTGACQGSSAMGCDSEGGTFVSYWTKPNGCCCCKPKGTCGKSSDGACVGMAAYGCTHDGGKFVFYPDNKTMEGCCCLGGRHATMAQYGHVVV